LAINWFGLVLLEGKKEGREPPQLRPSFQKLRVSSLTTTFKLNCPGGIGGNIPIFLGTKPGI